MRQNKLGQTLLLVMGLSCALSACSEGKTASNGTPAQPAAHSADITVPWSVIFGGHTDPTTETVPSTQSEAHSWLKQEWQKIQSLRAEPAANRLGEQLQNADRRLVRTIEPTDGVVAISTPVFMAMNKGAERKTVQQQANQQLQQRLTQTAHRLLDDLDATTRPAPVAPESKPMASSTPDLSQAEHQQIKYLGLMSVGAEEFGLVRVGERVYRVTPNMPIGRGQWRIIRMDATAMQVLIDGQTVNYGK